MPQRLTWRRLLPGLLALGAVVLTAVAVLLFAGIGQLHGRKMSLYFLSDQARGVMRGTEVWLAGQKIGLVDRVDFRPPTNDSLGHVLIVATVLTRVADQIRRDSRTDVRAGANFVAPVVVYVSAGTPGSPTVRDGDTIRARAQSDFEVAGTKIGAATADFRPIINNSRSVVALLH